MKLLTIDMGFWKNMDANEIDFILNVHKLSVCIKLKPNYFKKQYSSSSFYLPKVICECKMAWSTQQVSSMHKTWNYPTKIAILNLYFYFR